MCVVAPLEIRGFSKLVNEARVVEDCSRKTTLIRDTRGCTSRRGRGKYFPLRGHILKRDGHATHHPHGQRNFQRNNNVQFHRVKGNSRCYTCGLFRQIAKDCRRGKNQGASQNQQ
ncbi:hypothetical protein AHAS_Ahas20G0176500 [Arachis hypogaea]